MAEITAKQEFCSTKAKSDKKTSQVLNLNNESLPGNYYCNLSGNSLRFLR
jgi:hypothetical protein